MIVPLIDNQDTKTKIFPIYSHKKVVSATANLPNVLNEVIRLSSATGGLGKHHNSSTLRRLPKSTNSQQMLSGHRPRALANLSGVTNCKYCPKIAQQSRPIKVSPFIAPRALTKVLDSKTSMKIKCNSCMTDIDAGFKYCPSCGVIRRPYRPDSTMSIDQSSSSSKSRKSNPCLRCIKKVYSKQQKKVARVNKEKDDNDIFAFKESFEEMSLASQTEKIANEMQGLKNVTISPPLPIRSKSGSYDLEAISGDIAIPKDQLGPLFECPTCLRTFLAKSLAIHRRSCGHSLNFQRRLLDEDTFQPILSNSKLRKNSLKGRWRP